MRHLRFYFILCEAIRRRHPSANKKHQRHHHHQQQQHQQQTKTRVRRRWIIAALCLSVITILVGSSMVQSFKNLESKNHVDGSSANNDSNLRSQQQHQEQQPVLLQQLQQKKNGTMGMTNPRTPNPKNKMNRNKGGGRRRRKGKKNRSRFFVCRKYKLKHKRRWKACLQRVRNEGKPVWYVPKIREDLPPTANITVYVDQTVSQNPSIISLFQSGHVRRFGTGRVDYNLVYSSCKCRNVTTTTGTTNHTATGAALSTNATDQSTQTHLSSPPPPPPPPPPPCLTITRTVHVGICKSAFPTCTVMLAGDERCAGNRNFLDAILGYDGKDKFELQKYLPLGPRNDFWYAFEGIMTTPPTPPQATVPAVQGASSDEGEVQDNAVEEARNNTNKWDLLQKTLTELEKKEEKKKKKKKNAIERQYTHPTSVAPSMFDIVTKPASERKYVYNAIFSKDTDRSRAWLAEELEKPSNRAAYPSFLKMAEKWTPPSRIRKSEGHLDPAGYARVLLDSVFTLSPSGHHPECFRIYEAIEAGSIPVIVTGDKRYKLGKCHEPLYRMIDAGAPFVILNSWEDWFPYLATVMASTDNKNHTSTMINDMQSSLHTWYHQYMKTTVRDFESFFVKDIDTQLPNSTATDDDDTVATTK